LVADTDPGKAQRRRAAQRLNRKLFALVPACGLRQPLLAGKGPRRLGERPLFVGELEIHRPRLRAEPTAGQPDSRALQEAAPSQLSPAFWWCCSSRSNCLTTALQGGISASVLRSG